jgi:hypothetical protein
VLPRTERLRQRPVWQRHMRRTLQNLAQMDPPTERERWDAIQVLRDPENVIVPSLWVEAHLILDESSPRKENT